MINLILNWLLKKEQKQLSLDSRIKKRHYIKIILEVEYLTGKLGMVYSNSNEVTSDDRETFIKLKEEKIKEYVEAIKAIHINLDDKSSEFINVNNNILIKKSDFTNARIVYKYE